MKLLWHGYWLMVNTNVCCPIPPHGIPIGMTFLWTSLEIWTRFKKFRKNFPIFLDKRLKQNHRPAKLYYSFSSKWRKNSGELKICLPKTKVPVCLWLELWTIICWGASLRAVIRGVATGERGTISRASNHRGGAEKS